MTHLRQRMLEDMQLRCLAVRTQESYLGAVRRLAEHYGRPPDLLRTCTLSAERFIHRFLHHVLSKDFFKVRYYQGAFPRSAGAGQSCSLAAGAGRCSRQSHRHFLTR